MSWYPVNRSRSRSRALEIHQTWKTEDTLTSDMKYSISEWKRLHPHLVHRFWDDEACDEFMRERYLEFYPTYVDLPFGVQKADMFRIAVLHDRGGIYADTDLVPNVVIDESPLWGKGDLIFASWENQTNAFMISKRRGHPALLKALQLIVVRHRRCRLFGVYQSVWRIVWYPMIIYVTGPALVRAAVGRTDGVYYIPLHEWMPCDRCIEYTNLCPENTGRYFNHLNGKVWNTSVEARQNQLMCILKYNWKWLLIVLCWVVYSYRTKLPCSSGSNPAHFNRIV